MKILVTVDAVIERDDKILLIRRKNEPFKGHWALPGGFIEYGESAEEAVKREIKEEAALEIKIKRLLGVYSAFGRDPRGHVISICYVAKAQGKERGGSDAEDARFFSLAELKKEKLAFDHSKIIEDYKKGIHNVLR